MDLLTLISPDLCYITDRPEATQYYLPLAPVRAPIGPSPATNSPRRGTMVRRASSAPGRPPPTWCADYPCTHPGTPPGTAQQSTGTPGGTQAGRGVPVGVRGKRADATAIGATAMVREGRRHPPVSAFMCSSYVSTDDATYRRDRYVARSCLV